MYVCMYWICEELRIVLGILVRKTLDREASIERSLGEQDSYITSFPLLTN